MNVQVKKQHITSYIYILDMVLYPLLGEKIGPEIPIFFFLHSFPPVFLKIYHQKA